MPSLSALLLMALAGGLGTLTRFGLGRMVQRILGDQFPFGTMAANLLGCLLFGIVWQLTAGRPQPASELRLVVLTGFMGGLTTFSTFAFESWSLLGEGALFMALLNIGSSLLLGLGAVATGVLLVRSVTG